MRRSGRTNLAILCGIVALAMLVGTLACPKKDNAALDEQSPRVYSSRATTSKPIMAPPEFEAQQTNTGTTGDPFAPVGSNPQPSPPPLGGVPTGTMYKENPSASSPSVSPVPPGGPSVNGMALNPQTHQWEKVQYDPTTPLSPEAQRQAQSLMNHAFDRGNVGGPQF